LPPSGAQGAVPGLSSTDTVAVSVTTTANVHAKNSTALNNKPITSETTTPTTATSVKVGARGSKGGSSHRRRLSASANGASSLTLTLQAPADVSEKLIGFSLSCIKVYLIHAGMTLD